MGRRLVAALPDAAVKLARAATAGVLLVAACACAAWAQEAPAAWTGTVVALSDGDTVTVLDEMKVQHRVRLAAIDAPERGAAYARVARDHLATLVFRRNVEVQPVARDRYGRAVARILVEGKDAGLELVRAGLAWHFIRYPLEDPEQRRLYEAAEAEARLRRRGLWVLPAPEAPWDYRARQRAETIAPR